MTQLVAFYFPAPALRSQTSIITNGVQMRLGGLVLRMTLIAIAVMPVRSQAGQRPSFEVASVKPAMPGATIVRLVMRGERFVATNVTLRTLLQNAYSHGSPLFEVLIIDHVEKPTEN
jgi:hypothetical protein